MASTSRPSNIAEWGSEIDRLLIDSESETSEIDYALQDFQLSSSDSEKNLMFTQALGRVGMLLINFLILETFLMLGLGLIESDQIWCGRVWKIIQVKGNYFLKTVAPKYKRIVYWKHSFTFLMKFLYIKL